MKSPTQRADRAVAQKVRQIIQSRASDETKLAILNDLELRVIEHHPDGWAAKSALKMISDAQQEIMYPPIAVKVPAELWPLSN